MRICNITSFEVIFFFTQFKKGFFGNKFQILSICKSMVIFIQFVAQPLWNLVHIIIANPRVTLKKI